MWGIEELSISGLDEQTEDAPALDPAVLAEYEPTAREIYTHASLDHPVMQQLFTMTIQRLAEQAHHGAFHGA
jgi:hypothetical protein